MLSSISRRHAALLVACLSLPLTVSEAFGQEAPRRPFRRIFGQVPERAGSRQALDVTVSFQQAYDDNVLGDQLPQGEPRFTSSGSFPTAAIDARYRKRGQRAVFTAAAGTALQYYSQIDGGTLDRSHQASADLDLPVGQRTRLRLGQTASFATYFTLLGLPGNTIPEPGPTAPGQALLSAGPQFAAASDQGAEYHTAVGMTRQIGRRASFDWRYGYALTNLRDIQAAFHEAGVSYRREVNRSAALVLGYAYETGGASDSVDPISYHDINIGIDYRRAISRSRNTSIAFSTGSAVVERHGARDYRLLGDARLFHLFGRSWTTSVGYHRGAEFMGVLGQFVSNDSVVATLDGFINPRLEASTSASYSTGHIGQVRDAGNGLRTYSGTARLQYAISRSIAVDVRLLSYYYEFGSTVDLPTGLSSNLTRYSARVGLTVWLPLVR